MTKTSKKIYISATKPLKEITKKIKLKQLFACRFSFYSSHFVRKFNHTEVEILKKQYNIVLLEKTTQLKVQYLNTRYV